MSHCAPEATKPIRFLFKPKTVTRNVFTLPETKFVICVTCNDADN